MKLAIPSQIVLSALLAFHIFHSAPAAFADEAAAAGEAQEESTTPADFSQIAQNDTPSGLAHVKPSTYPENGLQTPSGQALNSEPVQSTDLMTLQEYTESLEKLRQDYADGKITARKYNRRVKKLVRRWRRSEEYRGHGYDKKNLTDQHPIDTRAIQIERRSIRVDGPSDSP